MIRKLLHRILIVAGLSLGALLLYYLFWFVIDPDLRSMFTKGWPFHPAEMLIDYATCCLFSLFATIYYWRYYEKTERERDKFRLQALENQLSPHFVFNNFSILAELIEVDPKRASGYLMNLSKVYRYTLSHLDHSTVPLQEELNYLHLYLQLLEERFGNTIRINIAPDVTQLEGDVPPAVLQMLVENAIKHNEHTEVHPLIIDLTAEKKQLKVKNNKRTIATTDSVQIGNHNIVERYRLLTRQKVIINETDDTYTVSIPLIPHKK